VRVLSPIWASQEPVGTAVTAALKIQM
jgi:hypothetical protein